MAHGPGMRVPSSPWSDQVSACLARRVPSCLVLIAHLLAFTTAPLLGYGNKTVLLTQLFLSHTVININPVLLHSSHCIFQSLCTMHTSLLRIESAECDAWPEATGLLEANSPWNPAADGFVCCSFQSTAYPWEQAGSAGSCAVQGAKQQSPGWISMPSSMLCAQELNAAGSVSRLIFAGLQLGQTESQFALSCPQMVPLVVFLLELWVHILCMRCHGWLELCAGKVRELQVTRDKYVDVKASSTGGFACRMSSR